MKARGLPSRDDADALACTFAEPIMPVDNFAYHNPIDLDLSFFGVAKDYDRYAEMDGRDW